MKFRKLFMIAISIIGTILLIEHVGGVGVSASKTDPAPIPKGIMSFGWGKNFLDTKSLDLPYISGMTAYFGWRDLQPEENKYDFSAIDTLVSLAKAKNKIINIGFYPGANAPEWIYRKGAKSFSWARKLKEDQARIRREEFLQKTSPLPWDPIFLKYWKDFISKVAEKYKDEPTVGYISLTGPVIDETATGILLKNDEDWKRFVNSGYTYEKLLNSWIEIIEYYEKTMSNKRLVLALAPMRPGSPDISRSKDLVEYVIGKKYTNISFLCVFLNDTWFLTGKAAKDIRNLLKKAKERGYNFGYQMAQSAYRNATWKLASPIVVSLKESLSIGIADCATWIEVWHDDIIDPKYKRKGTPNSRYVDDLKWAHQTIMKKF